MYDIAMCLIVLIVIVKVLVQYNVDVLCIMYHIFAWSTIYIVQEIKILNMVCNYFTHRHDVAIICCLEINVLYWAGHVNINLLIFKYYSVYSRDVRILISVLALMLFLAILINIGKAINAHYQVILFMTPYNCILTWLMQ